MDMARPLAKLVDRCRVAFDPGDLQADLSESGGKCESNISHPYDADALIFGRGAGQDAKLSKKERQPVCTATELSVSRQNRLVPSRVSVITNTSESENTFSHLTCHTWPLPSGLEINDQDRNLDRLRR
jgi:hypothetical protein